MISLTIMPASLLSAKIRGVRSYSPYEHKAQIIEFMPLTLIVGANGSGKTTVIESLKFIISGEEPPLSDCRRNFLHTTKNPVNSFDTNTSYASIELQFQTSNDQHCIAKRDISKSISTKSGTPSISSSYKINQKAWSHIHRQDDWTKTIPRLFNLPNQSILNNVILCHQEDNLWCMGDSSTVKQIFDKIFGCEQYKKEIKYMDAEIKACKAELVLGTKDSVHWAEKVATFKKLKSNFSDLKDEIDEISTRTSLFDTQINDTTVAKERVLKEIRAIEVTLKEIESLKQRASEVNGRSDTLRKSLGEAFLDPQLISDSDLDRRMKDYAELVNLKRQRRTKVGDEEEQMKRDIVKLDERRISQQDLINKLKVSELKAHETYASLTLKLRAIKEEQQLDEINIEEMEKNLKTLENFEKVLLQNKCDQTEMEDHLSNKLHKLSKDISNLNGSEQGLVHKIKSKEVFIKKLSDQLAAADPLAEDLFLVLSNLGKMSSIANQIPHSELVADLKKLIEESSGVIDHLVSRIKKDSIAKLTEEIAAENAEIEDTKNQLKNLDYQKIELLDQETKIRAEHNEVRAASKETHKKVVLFQSVRSDVVTVYSQYIRDKRVMESNNLVDRSKELDLINGEIESKRAELNSLSLERSRLSEEIEQSFTEQEVFKNNVLVRELIKKMETIEMALSSALKNIRDEKEFHDLRSELNEIERLDIELRHKRSMIAGSKIQLDQNLARTKEALNDHAKTNSKYAECLGKIVCNKIIISDLEKLKECFQVSIITFHDQMIAKINQVLRLRWRQVYKGSDIDHIELVDEEVTKGAKGDKKIYNYYIAMRKGGVRMKMREKSSAGQKALASIILRMTLAELFVKDFAFIALDEPTANLDLANVQSLANTIGSYVKRRAKNGANIQWLIITHDEQFLRALDAECSPYYYRVELDHEGCSKIVKISYQGDPTISVPCKREGIER